MTGKRTGSSFLRVSPAASLLVCLFYTTGSSSAYSVLTHEAIIDAEWDDQIKPLLLERFPGATAEQLRQAQAYAYGGCVIQDLGYYPFASRFFSHLTHYVRSGDFVEALFEESRNINDYAFALGALSHYVADIQGHSLAVNRAVPLLYPGLHKKYGDWMTWEDSPWAHALTEFGFDTLEVVAGHVAPQKYHDWIGFKVAKPVLERAFRRTYGLELKDQILRVNLAIGSYDEFASQVIPEMTEVAWALRRKQLEERAASLHHRRLFHLSHKNFAAWEKKRTKPGAGDQLQAFIFRLIPKFGPLNAFDFHAPTVLTEQLFADSLKATIQNYESRLREAQGGLFDPPNVDLDTGRPTRPGEYAYCDHTYAKLLHKLEATHFAHVTPELRHNLISFYENPADNVVRTQHKHWQKLLHDLEELQAKRVPSRPRPPTTANASMPMTPR